MSSGTTEFLDYAGPVSKDTAVTQSGVRWNSKSLVGAVSKFNSQLVIPTFDFVSYPEDVGGNAHPSCCVGQFNYSIGQNFSFPNWQAENIIDTLLNCFLVLRYRVGTQAFRYCFFPQPIFQTFQFPAILYSGQEIKGNCTIEIWCNPEGAGPVVVSNSSEIILTTSILNNPANQEGQTTSIPQFIPAAFVRHQDINVVMPVALPIIWNPNQAWLSN